MERLLGMSKEQIMQYKDAPEKFEEIKNDLLGNQIKIVGRVNKNQLFGNLEIVANTIEKIDVEKLIEELEKE